MAALRLALALAALVVPGCVRAAVEPREGPTPSAVEAPLLFAGPFPAVELHIAGEGPFRFAVDTGAAGTRVSRTCAERLGLRAGGNRPVLLRSPEIAGFRLPDLLASVEGPRSGAAVDGVLGLGAFAGRRLVLDFPARRLRLDGASLPPPDGRLVLGLRGMGGGPRTLAAEAAGRPLDVLVDTGYPGGLLLPEAEARDLPWAGAVANAGELRAGGARHRLRGATLDGEFRLGARRWSRPRVVWGEGVLQPVLGLRFLRNTRVILDLREGRLSLGLPAPTRPDLVLVVLDDVGWKDLACYGHPFHETPRLDRFAAEGMRFTQAYSNGPNCAPSRASLQTGQYTPRHGIYTVNRSDRGKAENRRLVPVENRTDLPMEAVTLAEVLAGGGYACGHVGKWHLGPDPTAHGYEVNVAGNRTGSPRGGYFPPYRNPQLPDGPAGEYLTDRLTDEAIRFVTANRDRPFFLHLAFHSVHTPIQPRPDLREFYEKKRQRTGQDFDPDYAAMIGALDENIGRLLDTLAGLDLAERTLVVVFSDNGGHGRHTSMAPLRGSKGMLYEGGIRVPLLVRWPGQVPAGIEEDTPVMGADLYPTLLAAAGLPLPAGLEVDGANLLPLLRHTGALAPRDLYWHFPAYLEAYRGMEGPWRTTPAGVVRRGRWKLLEWFEDSRLELYDLQADPGETTNLVLEQESRARELHAALRAWRERLGAPMPEPKLLQPAR